MNGENLGTAQIIPKCPECLTGTLVIPEDAPDDAIIVCSACGRELGEWAKLRPILLSRAQDEFQKEVKRRLIEGLEDIPGFRPE